MRHSAWFLAPVIGIVAGLSSTRGDTVETDDPWKSLVASGRHTSAGHPAALKGIPGGSAWPSRLPAIRRPPGVAARSRRRAIFGCFGGATGAADNQNHLGQPRAVAAWCGDSYHPDRVPPTDRGRRR